MTPFVSQLPLSIPKRENGKLEHSNCPFPGALELLTVTYAIKQFEDEGEKIKNLEPFLQVDNDIGDDVKSQSKPDWLGNKRRVDLQHLNEILDLEHEYLDEEDDVVLWRAVVTSLAEWNYKKMLSKKNGREKRDKEPVCYQHVGCFLNDGPFSHLSHPSSPEEIDTKFYLYTGVKEEPDLISYMNLTSIRVSSFNASHVIKVIIHGFGSSCRRIWAKEMRHALLTVDDPNVICVDWEKGASLPNYPRATSNTRLVGRQVAILVNKIHEIFGTNNSMVHLIGFSLGAHVSGYAGAELRNVSRITGLDPAGPMFENQDIEARLDKTDGAFVDVIHSNGESLIMGGLGAWAPMGHIDFYPNGGRMQKGCTNLFLGAVTDIIFSSTPGDGRSLCNHRRAYKFFTDSVVPKCLFPAFPCENYDKFLAGECFPCSDDKCGNMGYYADKSPGSGIMYLATREEEPFCANQFKVVIYSSYNYPEAVSRGKIEIAFMRDEEYPDVFYMTKGPDEELRSGGKMVRMVVAHPLQDLPTKIRLIYTAYNGWLSSGLAYWSIDKLVITDSFGKNASYCKTGLVLPSGVSTTITLNQGDCIPVFYDVYAPNRDQIWKTADMNNKVVNLYGDVNFLDPKLQLLDPSTGRLLSMNNTHRFSATELNGTAAIYPYGPVDITVLQKHIPANIKVSKARKPLIPSLRFISSLQRHFRSKPKGGHSAQQETYYPAGRPIQEIPIDYKEQLPERNQTLELYPLPRPHPQIARPPVRGEQLAPVFGPNQPQYVPAYQPPRTANPEYKPPETVYVQAPGESPFQSKGGLQDYFIQEQPTNPEKMNGRREVTKHLGQELYLESTSVKYADQYYGPSEVQNYAQNYDYATGEDGEPFYEQKDEVADYDSLKTDFTDQSVKHNLEKPDFGQNENVEGGQGYSDNFRPVRYDLLNTAQSSEKPDQIPDLKGSLLHQTENTLIYRQSDGSVKMIFMPNQTSDYGDQIVSYTEREDMLSDEFEYYDEEYDEVPGAQLLSNDRVDNESETVLVSTSSVDKIPSNKTVTSVTSAKFEHEKSSKTDSLTGEVQSKSSETKPKDSLLPVTVDLKRGGNVTETRKLNATEDLVAATAKIEARTDPTTKTRKSEETIKIISDKRPNSTDVNTETAFVVGANKTGTSNESSIVINPPKGAKSTEAKTESVSVMSHQRTVNLTEAKIESAATTGKEKAVITTSIKTEIVPVITSQKDQSVTDNRIQLPSLKTQHLAADEPKEQSLSIQLTNNVKRNINVQLSVNRVDLQKAPSATIEEETQPRNKSSLNTVTTGLTPSTSLNASDEVGPSNQQLDADSTALPDGKLLNSMLQPQMVVISTLPTNASGANNTSLPIPAKVIIPAIPGENLVQAGQTTVSEPQRNTSSITKNQPLLSEADSSILEQPHTRFTSSPIVTKYDQSERVSSPSRRAQGAVLERKDFIKPITIMASVELTATAPSIVTEIPDNSSLIAQFANLGQADIRRSKSRNQESSRRENPLLADSSFRKVSGGVRGRDLKTGNNTVNNISDSPGKIGEMSATVLSTVQTQNITRARVPTRVSDATAASNAPDAPGKYGEITTTISSVVQIQNVTGAKVSTRLVEIPGVPNVTTNPFESLTTSTEPTKSTSTISPIISSTNSIRQLSRDAPRSTQQNTASDSTLKSDAEKKFPEVPITLIKFKAEDRVTERSKKTKEPVMVQHRLPEVVMAVPSETPLQGVSVVTELPLMHRIPEPGAQVHSETLQQHRLVDTFVSVPLDYRQPEITVGELPLPQATQAEETSFPEYSQQQRPGSSELSNPFGIPIERLSDRGFNKPPAISTQFGLPKTGSGVPLSPTATSRRNPAGKRPTLVYNPGELRPQNTPYDTRQSFAPHVVENQQKPDEIYPLRGDNAASDDFILAERVDHSKVRPIEDWPALPPGVRLSRFDEHQRHLIETAKLQTLSRDLMPPPLEFEEQGNRRRSRFNRYGSWIPNIWSYINPFGPKQDEADPKSSNGWMTYVWGQPGATPQNPPPPITPVVNQPARPVPVRRNFKVRNRPRTLETGASPVDYIVAV